MGPFVLASSVLLAGASFLTSPANAVVNCAQKPSACGYPDATNTGPRRGVVLKKVPGEVTSGPGWHWDSRGWVAIDRNSTVFYGFEVTGGIDVQADNVVIDNVSVIEKGESFGIALRHADNTVIRYSKITTPVGAERLLVGIKDIYGDSYGTRVVRNDISRASSGVQIYRGVIRGNYIHDLGYKTGDHVNGVTSNGGTTYLYIYHNTIFNQYDQADAIGLFQDFGVEANRTIDNNLMAGGGYTLYAGQNVGAPPAYNIKVTNNRFARKYWPKSGYWGPATAYNKTAAGNVWSNNVWDDSNQLLGPP